ncbi:MAG TPA: GH92 family glycosyl hydrolase [Candidatus Bacteroides merdigallinarum]|uniref:GH92 family glycosyl hydrolase n=1 Tax=Candidatus Bacteroides merdigallinarum TaxID=2838473 RepID=A0A9D2J151_9BACE|nr:GH92 family glycosyl hydrolase [Candidatus Bacteroides merdigallinarum]
MKTNFPLLSLSAAALLCLAAACTPAPQDYASYVDPFIGTGGHGHTYPGAVVPNGMIQPSPDTRIDEWDACSGYYYADSTLNGFSHTHLSGTGCADYGDVLLMPTVGAQDVRLVSAKSQQLPWCSAFSHEREVAEPGYYSVFLDRYGVQAELTSTARAAIHRYTFPEAEDAGFILDLDYSIQHQTNRDMVIEVVSDTELRGHKRTAYWLPDQYIAFYARFSKPFTCTLLTDSVAPQDGGPRQAVCKALLQFSTARGEQVLVKVGVSAVDMEGARRNVEADIPDWDFDGVRRAARQAWNDYLSCIDIETDDADQRTIFYTALYHTGIQPYLFTDADGRHRGMDGQIHQGDVSDPVYTAFSLWDTFRAFHPLMTLIRPEQNQAFIRSLLVKQREGGVFPKWELAANYTGTMIGYHAASLIADSYAKGQRDFDVQEAFRACLRTAEYDTTGIHTVRWMVPFLMPAAKYWKNKIGYIPCDKDNEAVAKALEYAYDDWCISQLAEALGNDSVQAQYAAFAQGYKTYFDPSTRFMRGLDSNRQWRTPFNPRSSNHRNDDYCEGTAWQWIWFVPHDVAGLVELMGGREAFIGKLDSLFTAPSDMEGEMVSVDISGLIGQYAHGNEPSHHIAHLYNYVGQPWRTQEVVDEVLHTLYTARPDGLSGNEDCGQMSAWYILNSLGFYQVCPGEPLYSIGRPLFDRAVLHLGNGRDLVITVRHNSPENKYVQQILLDGKELHTPFFTHQDIADGAQLEFVMGDRPKR